MLLYLVLTIATVASALSTYKGPLAGGVPAHQYPAGVSPEACPNFPNCENPSLAANPNEPVQKYQLANTRQSYQPNYQAYDQRAEAPAYQTYESPQPFDPYRQQYQTGPVQGRPIARVPYPSNYVDVAQKQVSRDDAEFTGAYAPKDALDAGEYVGDGDYRGEGLEESGAYEREQQPLGHRLHQQVRPAAAYYQPQTVQQQQQQQHYQQQTRRPIYDHQPQIVNHGPAAVPAGLDPNACPNYPYCHQ